MYSKLFINILTLMSMMKHNIAHKTLEQTFHNVFFLIAKMFTHKTVPH